MDENKHYLRLDTKSSVIYGFSDAFEQALVGDICINENVGRQFELNGIVNPPLFNDQIPIYKYSNSQIIELNQAEIDLYKASLPPQPPAEEDYLLDLDFRLSMIELGL